MKNEYTSVEIDVIRFESEDVIVTSVCTYEMPCDDDEG